VTEDDAAALLNWARITRFHAAMLNLVLRGWARIDLDDQGDPVWHHQPDAQPAAAPDSPRYMTGPVAEGDIPYAGAGFADEIYDLHTNELIATCDTADEATALAALLNDRERYETALKAIAAGAGDPAAVAAGALGKE
jgi:hypothetical protein